MTALCGLYFKMRCGTEANDLLYVHYILGFANGVTLGSAICMFSPACALSVQSQKLWVFFISSHYIVCVLSKFAPIVAERWPDFTQIL